MAQDLMNKHCVAEISRVSAVYGTGHILSGEMDKDRDNGEIVAVGAYKEGEYYTVSDFAGEFEAKVIEIVNHPGRTMVRFELTKDCDGYFVHNPETMPNDFLKVYQDIANFYNAEGDRARMYPMYKHDVFTVSVDAFGGTAPEIGATVSYADGTGYTVA
jgi:hypothetical protein